MRVARAGVEVVAGMGVESIKTTRKGRKMAAQAIQVSRHEQRARRRESSVTTARVIENDCGAHGPECGMAGLQVRRSLRRWVAMRMELAMMVRDGLTAEAEGKQAASTT